METIKDFPISLKLTYSDFIGSAKYGPAHILAAELLVMANPCENTCAMPYFVAC